LMNMTGFNHMPETVEKGIQIEIVPI
jgi:hypothetical protein